MDHVDAQKICVVRTQGNRNAGQMPYLDAQSWLLDFLK